MIFRIVRDQPTDHITLSFSSHSFSQLMLDGKQPTNQLRDPHQHCYCELSFLFKLKLKSFYILKSVLSICLIEAVLYIRDINFTYQQSKQLNGFFIIFFACFNYRHILDSLILIYNYNEALSC